LLYALADRNCNCGRTIWFVKREPDEVFSDNLSKYINGGEMSTWNDYPLQLQDP